MTEGQIFFTLVKLREAGPEGLTAARIAWFTGVNLLEAVMAAQELIRRGLAEYVPHPGPVIRVRYVPSSIERKIADHLEGEGD